MGVRFSQDPPYIPQIVKWYNGRLISDYRKFNSFSEDQFFKGSFMSDGGKGSNPRPYSVDSKTFSSNWDTIFKKKEEKEKCGNCDKCKCEDKKDNSGVV